MHTAWAEISMQILTVWLRFCCADINKETFSWEQELNIMKTRLFKYIENSTTEYWKFSDQNSDNFIISAQNIDCGYP